MALTSFGEGFDAAVIGASGGIGRAMAARLADDPSVRHVWALSRSKPPGLPGDASWRRCDVTDEASVRSAAEAVRAASRPLRLVVVASGILRGPGGEAPEKTWRSLRADAMLHAFLVNSIGPALVAREFLPLLDLDGKSAFAALSARVGSISDNRAGGWHSYRASKAALNMLVRTLAIELARRNPGAVCVGLHPGTVETALSEPFLRGRPGRTVFSPTQAAAALLDVVDGLTPSRSGRCFAWDGSEIAP